MENLLISFNVVAPLILYMLAGAALKKAKLIPEEVFPILNRVVFYVTLPLLCMKNIMGSNITAAFESPVLLYAAAGILLVFALCLILVPVFCKEDRRRGVIMQGIFRCNEAIFGLSVLGALLGEGNVPIMSVAVAVSVPFLNMLSVIVLEKYRGGKPGFFPMLGKIFRNPVILGCLMGFLMKLLRITVFPTALQTAVSGLAASTTPLAFIVLGGTLSFQSVKKDRTAIAVVAALRLVIMPAIAVGAGLLLGIRGEGILVLMILFGSPTANVTFPLACGAGADEKLAAEIVAITCALSIFTTFLFIFVLKQIGAF